MKKIITLIALLTASFSVNAAQTNTNTNDLEIAWSCDLEANISGTRVGLIVGGQKLKGEGLVTCYSLDGDSVKKVPVKVKISSLGVGLGFSEIKSLDVVALGVGVTNGPENLIGKYKVGATSGITFINAGLNVDVALGVSKNALGFEVGLMGEKSTGLDVHLHGMVMSIKPLN